MVQWCHGIPCVYLYFLFRTNVRKLGWKRLVRVIFLKVPFWNFIQSSFSTITRYSDNSILKYTLQLKILRTWIISSNSFIKTWVNLVFKSNPVFISILDSFYHSSFTLLPFDCWVWILSSASTPFFKNQ